MMDISYFGSIGGGVSSIMARVPGTRIMFSYEQAVQYLYADWLMGGVSPSGHHKAKLHKDACGRRTFFCAHLRV